jgi:hypothetical protein
MRWAGTNAIQLLILMAGFVLLGDRGQYRAGAPVLNSNRPILEALDALGLQ